MKKEFKIGDKVKIIKKSGEIPHHFKIGDIVTINNIDNTDNSFIGENEKDSQWVPFEDIAKIKEIIDRIIFRDNTTILFKDGKKYIAKCCDGDTYDKEKGLLVCLAKAHGYTFNDLQEMLKGAEVQGKKQDCKAEKSKFEIGDFVKVIDLGKRYSTYKQWFDIYAPKLKNKFAKANVEISEDTTYKIVAKGIHSSFLNDGMLYAIEDQQGVIFLIGEEGIKKARVKEVNRKVKKGDYVKLLCDFEGLKKGQIFKCIKDAYGLLYGGNVKLENGKTVLGNDVVVLEKYKPKGANNGN